MNGRFAIEESARAEAKVFNVESRPGIVWNSQDHFAQKLNEAMGRCKSKPKTALKWSQVVEPEGSARPREGEGCPSALRVQPGVVRVGRPAPGRAAPSPRSQAASPGPRLGAAVASSGQAAPTPPPSAAPEALPH